ncbi:DbpA RNA binding domain-containing protein, partial [Proteus mirabilis]
VRHIVGAIANEGDISSRYIGNIKLYGSHSTIELPKGMPGDLLSHFTRTRIMNKPLNMQLVGDAQPYRERRNSSRRDGQPQGGRRFSKGDQPPRRGNGERGNFRGRGNNENAPRRRSSTHNQ